MGRTLIAAALTALSTAATADPEGSVRSAYLACAVFDSTGLLSAPCEVSGWHSAVDVSIDTSAREAQEICRGVAAMLRDRAALFDPGWSLRIYSPFSSGNTIATCGL
ncbi:hypothetical protein [Wenxinia marina]|uniref:Uncharacterized protein n=1 Tax=Wenxinia marina DSM 24838 TaxID=1123501 RepID=A0A0D0Q5S9_9RHOB|nr:hypothetical protein [Wenxinia marina]KIQ67847.1 hypothetical protein Wenmar_03576 [Wenxinia marina DSM 24838]GGL74583.1 hypothetical protein GCM10011392_31510 [Wenxinia marina]